MKQIKDTLNPFSLADDQLYCLTTGRAASNEVKNDLLQIAEKGAQWYHEFVNECKDNPERFEKPIKRHKIKNFANDAVKIKLTGRDQRIKETSCTRDLFGRLLYLAASQNMDLAKVLSYPQTPVPFSLSHLGGAMNKTAKSSLARKIENRIISNIEPSNIDVHMNDTMLLLHTLSSLPVTYGGLAKTIFSKACSFA